MSRSCYICGKGTKSGGSVTRRGKAKKQGGVGKRTTGRSKRTFRPNLKKVKIEENGERKKVYVCTKCIKAGKVKKVF